MLNLNLQLNITHFPLVLALRLIKVNTCLLRIQHFSVFLHKRYSIPFEIKLILTSPPVWKILYKYTKYKNTNKYCTMCVHIKNSSIQHHYQYQGLSTSYWDNIRILARWLSGVFSTKPPSGHECRCTKRTLLNSHRYFRKLKIPALIRYNVEKKNGKLIF